MNRVQTLIRRIKDELQALKVATPLNLGQLKFPDQAPTASYSGSIDTSGQDYVIARIVATFTRSDGATTTPLVDFAFNYTISPTYQEFMASQGITITGNDPNVQSEFFIRGYENSTTDNSVTFNIDILNAAAGFVGQSATLGVTVEAISTVQGNLTIRRTI